MTASEQQTRDPEMERLEETRKQWPLVEPLDYESEAKLFSDIRGFRETFSDHTDPRFYSVTASADLLSYRVDEFGALPIILLYGAKDSGKSHTLEISLALDLNPIKTSSQSPASLYQLMHSFEVTVLMDEAEDMAPRRNESEESTEKRRILNCYRRGDVVMRASREGRIPTIYHIFRLKIVASTRLMHDTTMSRSIIVNTERSFRRIPMLLDQVQAGVLRAQLEKYYHAHKIEYAFEIEDLRTLIGDNRVTELFYPLVSVCPTEEGRYDLITLGMDMALSKEEEEGTNELANVLEAFLDAIGAATNAPHDETIRKVPVKPIAVAYNADREDSDKRKGQWVGEKMRSMGFKPAKVGHKSERGYYIDEPRLIRQVTHRLPDQLTRLSELLSACPPSHIVKAEGDESGRADTRTSTHHAGTGERPGN